MELIQQHAFPHAVRRFVRIFHILDRLRDAAPEFQFMQRDFALAVAALRLRLRRVSSAMALIVEFANPRRQCGLFVDAFEIHFRLNDLRLRQAFQICFTAQEFQMVARWSAAAVAVAERHKTAAVDGILLDAFTPTGENRIRERLRIIIVMQIREHLRSVDALPPEDVVRERIRAVVRPEDLLRAEPFDAAAFHDLRNGAAVAENIRQPHDLRIDAELVFEIFLSFLELADQRFTAGNIRVRLHPHGAFHKPLAALDGFLNPFIQIRIERFHTVVEIRLALQELVFGILVHQRQLVGERADAFALRLLQRPQPCHVNVRMAEAAHHRRRAAIVARQDFRQNSATSLYGLIPFVFRQFQINCQRHILQRVVNHRHAERLLVGDAVTQLQEAFHIQPQLVDMLVPNAERATSKTLRRIDMRFRVKPFGMRAAAACPWIAAKRLRQNLKRLAAFRLRHQQQFAAAVVTSAARNAVHPNGRFHAAWFELQHNSLAFRALRHFHRSLEPAQLPFRPPDIARLHFLKSLLFRNFRKHATVCDKTGQLHFAKLAIEKTRQRIAPIFNSSTPFWIQGHLIRLLK